ncbi:unnamed protein product [Strongylus vulgaris]|uniref:Uncharacterized protein n=1 Tax=Strongylus vulgaris TaxID=40348 RepID=A0A3P7JSN1_STRVU|nr:unnamed protein product [Strongylus vulgaris]
MHSGTFEYEPTIDDTYQVLLEEGDRPREVLIFHDTGGVPDNGPAELKRPYLQVSLFLNRKTSDKMIVA